MAPNQPTKVRPPVTTRKSARRGERGIHCVRVGRTMSARRASASRERSTRMVASERCARRASNSMETVIATSEATMPASGMRVQMLWLEAGGTEGLYMEGFASTLELGGAG